MAGEWITRGFESFRQGTFGNGGQNLYVSRAGVLQRIHQMDLNGDGWADLLVCNSQNHWERPPVYVYLDPFAGDARLELPSDGSVAGAVFDLNGDGYDDLVLAMDYNGSRSDLNAFIYYGGPDGLGEHHKVEVPVPRASAVACGDFNGDGRPDLACVTAGTLRLFPQSPLGFEPRRFVDLPVEAGQLVAGDLDGDGFDDLYVLGGGQARVYWGGPDGLAPDRCTLVQATVPPAPEAEAEELAPETEAVRAIAPVPAIIVLNGTPHLFLPGEEHALLAPVLPGREIGRPLLFRCPHAIAVAAGDVNGDGFLDLVFASRGHHDGQECSWVYWGSARGFDEARRTPLPSSEACDVAVGDLTGNGCADIALCQDRTPDSFTYHSLLYRAGKEGISPEPVRLESHDARRVFIARTQPAEYPQVILVNHRARRSGGDVDPVIYYGGPDGFLPERRRALKGRDCVDAVCCDIDDDGHVEIITANCSENAIDLDPGSFLFKARPEGHAYEPATVFPTSRAHGVCCADLNRDGYLDLVFVGFRNPELLIFYGGLEGYDLENPHRIRMEADGEVYQEPRWVYAADLNNDGWIDLFVPQITSDRSFILWNGPEGFSMERRQMLSVFHAACAQAADLTGNGYLDLVIGGHTPSLEGPHDSFLYIYWNGPEGLREDRRAQLPALGAEALAIADFNRDGYPDLFVANYHDGRVRDLDSFIYWGGPGGRFSAHRRSRLFMHSAAGAVACDFNEDGWVDLAVGYHKVDNDHLGHSGVWWNGPEGFSATRTTLLPTEGPHGLVRVGASNLADGGPEEYYTSAPFLLPEGAVLDHLEWEATVPPKCWVRAQVRSAASREALQSAPWQGPAGEGSWHERGGKIPSHHPAERWVQYRLALGARNGCGTPRVSAVRLAWRDGAE
ncbi:MAG TPA: VCBS repeat-containing protein [Armatimonadetes bacterium]|jgi:hypothetical protein|nr:VCBS repeat-containing protein [Armatimonadota bacterium]